MLTHTITFPFPFKRYNQEQKFLSFILEPDENGCKVWSGLTADNAGVFNIKNKALRAHRVAYMYYTQAEIPPEHQVLHTCGNKFCLTKEHLYLAPNPTKKERPPPQKVGARSNLTPDDIIDIRQRHNIDNETLASIALRYNKTIPTIWNIVKGITHKHVSFNPEHKPQQLP